MTDPEPCACDWPDLVAELNRRADHCIDLRDEHAFATRDHIRLQAKASTYRHAAELVAAMAARTTHRGDAPRSTE